MTKDDIPNLYILAIYYKKRATQILNSPWIIKDRVKNTKERLEGICRRVKIRTPCYKVNEASILHLFFSHFFCILGFIFFAFLLVNFDNFLIIMAIYNPTYTALYLTPFILSIVLFIIGFSILYDAYAVWLMKINKISVTYTDLEKRKKSAKTNHLETDRSRR